MTPQPATPDAPLQVPATPVGAVRNDATGRSNQVLATGATASGKRVGGRLLLTTAAFRAHGAALYKQTQGVPPDEVHFMSSVEQMRDLLAAYSSIEHVSILMHMGNNALKFDEQQPDLAQLQKALDGSVPRIARWSFDGCEIGRGTGTLYAFAAHFGIARMEAWTHYHHIEPWGKTVTQPASDRQIAEMHSEIERASNFLAKGDAGATYSSSEIESTLQQGTSVILISEVFTLNQEGWMLFEHVLGDSRWIDTATQQPVLQPWTNVRHPSEAWYPRTAAITRVVTSPEQASAFELYFSGNPELHRVVILPPLSAP